MKSFRFIHKTFLLRLILYFILIITITLSASSYFIYNYFSDSFKDEITNYNHRILNQAAIFSDDFIVKTISDLAMNQIIMSSEDPTINLLFYDTSKDNWEAILNVTNKLDKLVFQNRDFIDSFFIHSRSNNLMASSSIKATKFIDERSASGIEDFNWLSTFYSSNKSIMWFKTRNTHVYSDSISSTGDVITLVCSYPLSSTGSSIEGCIAVNIKEEALSNCLEKFNSSKTGRLFIIDNSGSIISHNDKSSLYRNISKEHFVRRILTSDASEDFITTLDKTEYVVSFVQSKFNNWYYVSLVPSELFYQKDYAIKKRIYIVTLIILFIVLILSNFLSFKIYVPFKKILDKYIPTHATANNPGKSLTEYYLLDNFIGNMSSKINTLQSTLDKNMFMIKHNLFNDLLKKPFVDQKNMKNTMSTLGIQFSNQYYTIILFTFCNEFVSKNHQENIQVYKYSIIDFINTLQKYTYDCYPIDTNTTSISVLLNTVSNESSAIEQLVNEVKSFCSENLNTQIIAGVGRSVDSMLYLHESYLDAKICLQYRFIFPEKSIFFFNDLSKINASPSIIPEDFFDKTNKLLKLGNYNDIKLHMEKLPDLAVETVVPYRELRKAVFRLSALLKEYTKDMNINLEKIADESTIANLSYPDNIYEFIKVFLQTAQASLDHVSNKKLSRNSDLVKKIKDYISENLHMVISLNSTAEAFNISSYHLSKIFKEETGINYIDYVVSCKIDRATNLLASTSLSIDEITSRVGYSHVTYFTRKFKEATGKTPNEYRNEILIKRQETL